MFSELKTREKKITFVLLVTLLLNIASASAKLWAGEKFRFVSLITSGVESLFDGSTNILALISIFIASRPADKKHPYGHNKYEAVASVIIASLLLFSSFEMGKEVFLKSTTPHKTEAGLPVIPLMSLGFSMLISLFVSWYEKRAARKYDSPILAADAEHTFGDFLISFAVGISLMMTYWGYEWVDLIVGSLISFYLVYLAIRILKLNLDELVDATPFVEKREIFDQVKQLPFVHDIHAIRARGSMRKLYLDFHLLLKDDLPLKQAHEIGHEAEDLIRSYFKQYAHSVDITVHIEPFITHHREHHADHQL